MRQSEAVLCRAAVEAVQVIRRQVESEEDAKKVKKAAWVRVRV